LNEVSLISGLVLIFFAGTPTIIACSGTSRVTTAFAPILAKYPTMTAPKI